MPRMKSIVMLWCWQMWTVLLQVIFVPWLVFIFCILIRASGYDKFTPAPRQSLTIPEIAVPATSCGILTVPKVEVSLEPPKVEVAARPAFPLPPLLRRRTTKLNAAH
jgi:heme/copper-type cytochrome/quinol oxidase subunit 2